MNQMRKIYGSKPPQPTRAYKDRLFRMIFKDKAEFLTLYNALNGTSYADPEALKITTLEYAVQQAVDTCTDKISERTQSGGDRATAIRIVHGILKFDLY